MKDTDSVIVMCHHCDRSTKYSRDAILNEVQRLEKYNYEILTCQYCSYKFSKVDFITALGALTKEESIYYKPKEEVLISSVYTYPNPNKDALEAIKEAEDAIKKLKEETAKQEEIKKREEEIKKMQEGKEYDEKIVGPVDMEQGTPGDRRCVTFLKTEGEIYGYAYLIGKYAFKTIEYIVAGIILVFVAIAMFIWEIIKHINWCIVCSAARIASFIGYGALIVYSAITLGIFKKPIFESFYTPWATIIGTTNDIYSYLVWTIIIVLIFTLPITIQLLWAFDSKSSRWAKVIKRSADKLIK